MLELKAKYYKNQNGAEFTVFLLLTKDKSELMK